MSAGISVGRNFKNPWFWGPLVPAVILLVLGVVAIDEKPTGTVLIAAGAAFWLLAAGGWVYVQRGRRWLEVRPEGFRLTGPGFEREGRDEDVRRMSCEVVRNFSEGVPKSVTCRVRFWLDGGDPLHLEHRQAMGPAGEFVTFVERVQGALLRRVTEEVKKGGAVTGEGWELTREELKVGEARHRVEDLSAVGTFDGRVCVWKRGENEAVFRVAAKSANAPILERLLVELIPKEEDGRRHVSGDDLGKILFERRSPRSLMGLLWLGTIAGGLIAAALLVSRQWGAGGALGGGAAFLGAWIWYLKGWAFRCHENGVMKVTRLGSKTIRYVDISEFTYGATRVFYNGVYTGTTLTLKFVSLAALGSEKIAYSASIPGLDEELDGLRDHIAKVIASRMAGELSNGKAVAWTPNLKLLPDGVEYRAAGFVGRKEPVKVAYADVHNFGMDKGYFHLWVKGKEKSVLQEPVSAPNFFPGFLLLCSMFRPTGEGGEAAGDGGGAEPSGAN